MKSLNDNHVGVLTPKRGRAGFTLLELLFVVLIIGIVMALLLPALEKGRKRTRRFDCINNLKQMGTAFHGFAHDHDDQFPFQVPVKEGGTLEFVKAISAVKGDTYFAYRHFQALSNELSGTKVFVCPTDKRTNASTFGVMLNHNISYFAGATARYDKPESILSGDRNISDGNVPGSLLRLTANTPAAWTSDCHEFKGNLLFADSHVEGVGNGALAGVIASSGLPINTLLPPLAPPNGVYPGGNTDPPVSAVAVLREYFQVPANSPAATPGAANTEVPPPPAAVPLLPPVPPAAPGAPPLPAAPAPVRPMMGARKTNTPPAKLIEETNLVMAANPAPATNKTDAALSSTQPGASLNSSEMPMPGLVILILQPERCWWCWILIMAVAVTSAFFLGRSIVHQRKSRWPERSPIPSSSVRG